VMVPRVVPRMITTWTWVLIRGSQSQTQNSTKGPKLGPRANGTSSKKELKAKTVEAQVKNFLSPKQMRTKTKMGLKR
jgi:hypothetical protein